MARPLSFQPEQKLHAAMLQFWQHGYDGLSINALSAKLELNKFSLYQQFGNKENFYQLALEHYRRTIYEALLSPLRTELGKESILDYLENFGRQLAKPGSSAGCLINNTLMAGESVPSGCRKLAGEMAGELYQLLKTNFELAARQDQLKANALECVNFTLMTIQALLMTRKNLGPVVMQNNLRFFTQQLQDW